MNEQATWKHLRRQRCEQETWRISLTIQLDALEMGEDDLPRYADRKRCLACRICYMTCPFAKNLDEDVQDKFG